MTYISLSVDFGLWTIYIDLNSHPNLIVYSRLCLYETNKQLQEPWHHDLYFTIGLLKTLANSVKGRVLTVEFYKELWLLCIGQIIEPRHDKTNNVTVRPAKMQISLGIRPGWMPRLIWVFAGRTPILLFLSCRGSYVFQSGNVNPCSPSTIKITMFPDKKMRPTDDSKHWSLLSEINNNIMIVPKRSSWYIPLYTISKMYWFKLFHFSEMCAHVKMLKDDF